MNESFSFVGTTCRFAEGGCGGDRQSPSIGHRVGNSLYVGTMHAVSYAGWGSCSGLVPDDMGPAARLLS